MTKKNNMNIFNLLIGILLILLPVLYLIYTNKNSKDKDKESFDYMDLSYDIEIYGGGLMLIILGVIMIYREIIHIL